MYRGRFSQVSLVVLADPAGPDDLFTGRALSGEAGQRLQAFLEAAGVTTGYLILRTVPVDTSDLTAAKRDTLVDRPEVRALLREALRKLAAANSGLGALVAVGRGARRLAAHVVPGGLPLVEMKASGEPGASSTWQAALDRLAGLQYAKDIVNPTFHIGTPRGHVPSIDLPYGTPRWVGSSGDRASRPIDRTTGRPSADYLKLYLPTWVSRLAAPPLSPAEQAAADLLA
jgi:hypothetical protein